MNSPTSKSIILASKSPRRRELLKNIIRDLFVIPSLFDENSVPLTNPEDYVKELSFYKANEISKLYPNNWVIGADTIVVIDNNILGKPINKKNASNMLRRLSGKKHQVFTGYTIKCINRSTKLIRVVSTDVEFKKLNENEIEYYISTGESFDKSGGYAIQGIGAFIVKKINGSYTNVMGLPICEVLDDLTCMNIIKI